MRTSATVTVVGCTYADNVGGYGGGMGNSGSATLVGCTFVGNTAQSEGGGFGGEQLGPELRSSSELINCSCIDRTAVVVGVGSDSGYMTAAPCRVDECGIRDNQTFGGGGGLSIIGDSATTVTMTSCLIEDNRAVGIWWATGSGGLGVTGVATTVTDCVISDNDTYGSAGGVGGDTVTMTRCTMSGNSAGGYRAAALRFMARR